MKTLEIRRQEYTIEAGDVFFRYNDDKNFYYAPVGQDNKWKLPHHSYSATGGNRSVSVPLKYSKKLESFLKDQPSTTKDANGYKVTYCKVYKLDETVEEEKDLLEIVGVSINFKGEYEMEVGSIKKETNKMYIFKEHSLGLKCYSQINKDEVGEVYRNGSGFYFNGFYSYCFIDDLDEIKHILYNKMKVSLKENLSKAESELKNFNEKMKEEGYVG